MTEKNVSPPDATQKPEGADEREEAKYSFPSSSSTRTNMTFF